GTLLISAIVAALGGLLVVRPSLPPGRRGASRPRWLVGPLRTAIWTRLRRRRACPPRRPRPSSSASSTAVMAPVIGAAADAAVIDAGANAALRGSRPRHLGPAGRSTTAVPAVTSCRTPWPSLFKLPTPGKLHGNGINLAKQATVLAGKLRDFGVDGGIVQVLPGPVVTMYEFAPASGIKVSRIVNLADDLALGLKAPVVRIVAP